MMICVRSKDLYLFLKLNSFADNFVSMRKVVLKLTKWNFGNFFKRYRHLSHIDFDTKLHTCAALVRVVPTRDTRYLPLNRRFEAMQSQLDLTQIFVLN